MKLSGHKPSMSPSVSPPTVAFGQFGSATHNSHAPHNATSTSSQTILMPSESASSAGHPLEVTPVSVSTSSPLSAGAATPVTMTNTQPPRAPSGTPCCESGRPVLTDPITGQTVCSCQYDAHLLNYQRLAASTGLSLGMYGPSAATPLPLPPGQLPSAFYPPTANGFDLKENLEAWRSLPYAAASMYYPYDGGALAGYPFANGYGMDLNGARRKNATRETTSTLKAWLSEHRKNPYPTKGEKIMLAIITKMTLTQVSTWFANARRRLKKENKMTWSPRNRCDDDDDAAGSPRNRCDDDADATGSQGNRSDDEVDVDVDAEDSSESRINDRLMNTQDVDAINSSQRRDASQSSSNSNAVNELNIHLPHTSANRPRIWSIVDIATSTNSSSTSGRPTNYLLHKR